MLIDHETYFAAVATEKYVDNIHGIEKAEFKISREVSINAFPDHRKFIIYTIGLFVPQYVRVGDAMFIYWRCECLVPWVECPSAQGSKCKRVPVGASTGTAPLFI